MNLQLQLDRGASLPLQDQLFEQLRQLIFAGKLKPNSRVIATRFLAEQVGVSRTTVLLAYERLISEGYLSARGTTGTFVSATLPDQPGLVCSNNLPSDIPRQASLHPTTFRASPTPPANVPDRIIDFSPSRFDVSHLLPSKTWLQAMRNVIARVADEHVNPQPAVGVLSLRRAIVDYLAITRGIMASPEQVITVTGRRQACSLVAHLFQGRGDRVVIETPGNEHVANFFKARDANLIRVPVDEHGLQTDLLPQGPVTLAYVTPGRQDPLGGIMPQSRRAALIEWARGAGAYVLEDDCDSQFRYRGTTPQPLAMLDPYGLVFYAGSFTKMLGTGLGLGYLVVPIEFVEPMSAMKSMAEDGCPWIEQMVMADLLTSGEYDRHLRRLRKIYLERRDCLVQVLREQFGEIDLIGLEVGMQLTWLLPEHLPKAHDVCEAARAHGVNIQSVAGGTSPIDGGTCYSEKALIFGYAALAHERIREGIKRLANAIRP